MDSSSPTSAPAASQTSLESAGAQRLLSQFRPRLAERMPARELGAEAVVAAGFLAAAIPLAVLLSGRGDRSALVAAMFVALYAVTSRVEFDVAAGYGVPTQLVLVPMLFVLPPGWVPLLIAAGFVVGKLPSYLTGTRHPDRALSAVANAWHALGPALTFVIADRAGVARSDWGLLLGALVAQVSFDLLGTVAREWLRLGEVPRLSVRLIGSVYLTDLCLSPIAAAIALASVGHPELAALSLPLSGLLVIFARERRARVAATLELSQAYRGTALLLGDLVESDDSYTGSHSRDVVELATAVGPRLGLDEDQMRRLEFAALLHDLGKIAIPNSIINKAGPLTGDERALIETHTLEGEALLLPVGGLLGEVGRVVRSCHERFDGLGYPDGIAGEKVPIEARIVAACDAFNAMTTDRPYRAALSLEEAIDELQVHRGTQFDPAVVDVLVALHPIAVAGDLRPALTEAAA